jgi:hypothetical protein
MRQRVQLFAQAIERAALAPDRVRGVRQLVRVQMQAEVARGSVPGLLTAADVQRSVE